MAACARTLRPTKNDTFAYGPAERERLRILLVDDEYSTLNILSGALKSAGYNLYPAHTGEDALRKYPSARPELILLDLFSPDMDGKDLLRRLRTWTSAPILVMSARNEESEIIACLDAGADDYNHETGRHGRIAGADSGCFAAGFRRHAMRSIHGWRPQSGFRPAGGIRRHRTDQTDSYRISTSERSRSARRPVRTHHQLIHEVWGGTQYQDAVHLLRVTVSNLRRKLASDAGHVLPIVAEPGVGYRLRSDSAYPCSVFFAQAK